MLNTISETEAKNLIMFWRKGMQLFAVVQMNAYFFETLNNDTTIIWVGDILCSIGLHWLQWQYEHIYWFIMATEVKKRFSPSSKHITFTEHSKMAKAVTSTCYLWLQRLKELIDNEDNCETYSAMFNFSLAVMENLF